MNVEADAKNKHLFTTDVLWVQVESSGSRKAPR